MCESSQCLLPKLHSSDEIWYFCRRLKSLKDEVTVRNSSITEQGRASRLVSDLLPRVRGAFDAGGTVWREGTQQGRSVGRM